MKLTPLQLYQLTRFVSYVIRTWPEPTEKSTGMIANNHMMRWEVELKALINREKELPTLGLLSTNLPTYEEFHTDLELEEILDYFLDYYDDKAPIIETDAERQRVLEVFEKTLVMIAGDYPNATKEYKKSSFVRGACDMAMAFFKDISFAREVDRIRNKIFP